MKMLRYALLLAISIVFSVSAQSQITPDPGTWTIEAKKTGVNTYDIIFHLKLKADWHIFSLTPGGDGNQLAPVFKLDKVKLKGKMRENGQLIKKKLEAIDGIVNYYSGDVDYVQSVTATNGTIVTGSYKYQVCTDNMCLAPKTKKFELALK